MVSPSSEELRLKDNQVVSQVTMPVQLLPKFQAKDIVGKMQVKRLSDNSVHSVSCFVDLSIARKSPFASLSDIKCIAYCGDLAIIASSNRKGLRSAFVSQVHHSFLVPVDFLQCLHICCWSSCPAQCFQHCPLRNTVEGFF